MKSNPKTPEISPWPMRIGWLGSIAWIILMFIYFKISKIAIRAIDPAELGSFIAGALALLAFFWLIVGHMQQANALRLQAKELSAQIEQNRQLLETEIERTKREMALAQPKFIGASHGSSSGNQHFSIRNVGADAFDTSFSESSIDIGFIVNTGKHIPPNSTMEFQIGNNTSAKFKLHYTDRYGQRHFVWIEFSGREQARSGTMDEEH